jgi:hypothetical protein
MKKLLFVAFFFLSISISNVNAQEKFGRTLNLGAGFGYYGYMGGIGPAVNVNYEFDLVKNVTLAPSVGFYTYHNDYYFGDYYYNGNYYGSNNYGYRDIVIPIGAKGTYYFDDLLNLPKQFDLYAAASAGVVFRSRTWDAGYNAAYYGKKYYGHTYSPIYIDAHAGGEYHLNKGIGFYVDLSTGFSTVGIALHMN